MAVCETITTPAGNTARLQLGKPWDDLTDEERGLLVQVVDAAAVKLAALPDTSCRACGAESWFPHCYPAKRAKGETCCPDCDHTPRDRTPDA